LKLPHQNDNQITHPKSWRFHSLPGIFETGEAWQRYRGFHSGGFAECFVVERTDDKKKYALKIISKKMLEKPKARQKVLSILYRCCHRLSFTVERSTKISASWRERLKTMTMSTCYCNYVRTAYISLLFRICSKW
jgi:hypothetical protein